VVAELDGGLRTEAAPPAHLDSRLQLEQPASWPSNLRFVRRPSLTSIVADVPPGARATEQAAALRAFVRDGVLPAGGAATEADLAVLADALRERAGPATAVVTRGAGLELRLHAADVVRPVTLAPETDGLRLHATVSRDVDGADAAFLDQCLRCNGQARFARLVLREGVLFAEARLTAAEFAAELGGERTLRTARAVAALAQHAALPLTILRDDAGARAAYARTVLSPSAEGERQQPTTAPRRRIDDPTDHDRQGARP